MSILPWYLWVVIYFTGSGLLHGALKQEDENASLLKKDEFRIPWWGLLIVSLFWFMVPLAIVYMLSSEVSAFVYRKISDRDPNLLAARIVRATKGE
jgi:hypothetical protein